MSDTTTLPTAEEIKNRVSLTGLIGEVVELKREGREVAGLCPFHEERTPSFYVMEQRGFYHCFGCGANGDAINFVMEYEKMKFNDARRYLAGRAGMVTTGPRQKPLAKRHSNSPRYENERKVHAIQWALECWKKAIPSSATPAEHYLRGRSIDPDLFGGMPPSIKYHPRHKHTETGNYYPVMISAIQAPDGRVCGIHRTFLEVRQDAWPRVVKAPVPSSKKMNGLVRAGAVRLAKAQHTMAIAEGIETALSVMQSTGYPTWAALSLNNLSELILPETVQEVLLCADGDNKDKDAAEKQLQKAVASFQEQNLKVRIMRPPDGMDFNDVLKAQHQPEGHRPKT